MKAQYLLSLCLIHHSYCSVIIRVSADMLHGIVHLVISIGISKDKKETDSLCLQSLIISEVFLHVCRLITICLTE